MISHEEAGNNFSELRRMRLQRLSCQLSEALRRTPAKHKNWNKTYAMLWRTNRLLETLPYGIGVDKKDAVK